MTRAEVVWAASVYESLGMRDARDRAEIAIRTWADDEVIELVTFYERKLVLQRDGQRCKIVLQRDGTASISWWSTPYAWAVMIVEALNQEVTL